MMEVRRVDKLQVGEVYTEEGSREVRAIRRWTENTVDFKIIRLLQREVPQNLIDEDCAKSQIADRGTGTKIKVLSRIHK